MGRLECFLYLGVSFKSFSTTLYTNNITLFLAENLLQDREQLCNYLNSCGEDYPSPLPPPLSLPQHVL